MRVSVFGDVMCDITLFNRIKYGTDDYHSIFENIRNILDESDYCICNLETPIAGEDLEYVNKPFSFNAPIEFAKTIKDVGFDMVICANNHCLDRGVEGLRNTVENLSKCGLEFIGIHTKKEESYKIVEISGVKIGLINFTYGTNAFANNIYLKRKESFLVDLLQKQELHSPFARKVRSERTIFFGAIRFLLRKLKLGQLDVLPYERKELDLLEKKRFITAIKKCRKAGAEFIMVLPHIGGQYNDSPSEYTKKICDIALKNSADAVIANHEHVIHHINIEELRKNKLIAYCLGNFLGTNGVLRAPWDKDAEFSMAVHIDIINGEINYSFSLYKTIIDKEGKLRIVNLYDLLQKSDNEEEKRKIEQDTNKLVNRILCTANLEYPIKKYYKLNI